MRRLQAKLEVSLYALIVLSAFMLATAEGTDRFSPQLLTLPIALLAFFLVERWHKFTLPAWLANAFGLVSVLLAGMEMITGNEEAKLLSLAHFLVYLNWIILFQEKSVRHYWSLCALCVGQVAVGAVLTKAGIYGLMLVAFMFLSVWTLTVFSLYRSRQEFDRADEAAREAHALGSDATPSSQPTPANQLTAAIRRPSTTVGSVYSDPARTWINWRFTCSNLGTSSVALVLSFAVFLIIPRHPSIWGGGRTASSGSSRGVFRTGFAREVRLGDIGEILESTRRVFEVRLFNVETDEELDVVQYAHRLGYDEPYFRGSVMVDYQRGEGARRSRVWRSPPFGEPPLGAQPLSSSPLVVNGFVRQEYTLEPVDREILFAIPPIVGGVAKDVPEPIVRDRFTRVIRRPESARGLTTPFQYEVYAPKIVSTNGPVLLLLDRDTRIQRLHVPRQDHYQQVPPELEELSKLALQQAGMNEQPPPPPQERARRLLHFLRDSGQFGYTLNAGVFDASRDPIEDFLFNRRVGHCEYFATALTLMMRSVGIPSRLVSGFKGAERNPFTGHHEVQERHAHAWVEAFIDGHWQLLDPTPALARSEGVAQAGSGLDTWNQFRVALRDVWTRYVVNLNDFQQRSLLAPVKAAAIGMGQLVRGGWRQMTGLLVDAKNVIASPDRWISWQGGLVTFIFLVALSAIIWAMRRGWRFWQQWRTAYLNASRHAERQVEFYERFRRLCAQLGLKRRPAQTQREFAKQVAGELARRLPTPVGDHFPLPLAEAFYRVRFGQEPLTVDTLETIHRELSRLEAELGRAKA